MARLPARIAAALVILLIGFYGPALFIRGPSIPSDSAFQSREDVWFGLAPHHEAEQSFVFDAKYLSSIKFFVYVDRVALGAAPSITARLYRAKDDAFIAQNAIGLGHNSGTQEVDFNFPVQVDSENLEYILTMETDAPVGMISIWASSYDDYQEGALSIDASPTASDLTFFAYSQPPVALLISTLNLDRAKNAAFMLLVLACLGYPLNLILRADLSGYSSPVERVIWFVVLGLVPFPIILSILGLLQISLRSGVLQVSAAALLVLCSVLLILKIIKHRSHEELRVNWRSGEASLCLLLLLVFAVRLMQIDRLLVPNWTDGLQHTITLLSIIQNGRPPTDQIYHMGFHENAYLFESLLATSAPETILIFGQVLGLISGAALYLLAKRLFPEGQAALWSAVCYWFISTFPGYLVSWGRYPFLAGLTLLPIGALAVQTCFERRTVTNVVTACVVGTAILLCHYSVFAVWGLFVIATGLTKPKSLRPSRLALMALVLLVAPLLVLALVSPQIMSTLLAANQRSLYFSRISSSYSIVDSESLYTLGLTLAEGHWIIYAAGALGVAFSVMMRDKRIALLALWAALSIILSLATRLSLGVAFPSLVDVIIFLSIPICSVCGYALNAAWTSLVAPNRRLAAVLTCYLLFVVLMGAFCTVPIINPVTVLFRGDDQSAMDWITAHVNPYQRFMIDGFAGSLSYIPADAGGWIYPLTGRRTLYPSKPLPSKGLLTFINNHDISYVYVGTNQFSNDLRQLVLTNPDHFVRVCCTSAISIYQVSSTSKSRSANWTR